MNKVLELIPIQVYGRKGVRVILKVRNVKRFSVILLTAGAISACGSNNKSNTGSQSSDQQANETLYTKYDGLGTVQRIVDQLTTAVTIDPVTSPYFKVIDEPGHDTTDRFKSCLDLQFVSIFGGPATYPGVSHYRSAPPEGYACRDMMKAHEDLGITAAVFDQFVDDVSTVLFDQGISQQDISAILPAFTSQKPVIIKH